MSEYLFGEKATEVQRRKFKEIKSKKKTCIRDQCK